MTTIGTTIVRKFELHLVYEFYLFDEQQRDILNTKLLAYDEITSSQNNGTATMLYDPRFGEQWGLHNTGQSGGVEDMDIDAPEAWQVEPGENSVVMGIVDSGADLDHEDLNGKLIGDSYGSNPHGTHVAGIAGAWGNNGLGIMGVNWNGRMVSKNIQGADYNVMWDKIMGLFDYNTLEAMNCSWGLTEGDVVLIHRLFAFVYDVGLAPVAARGNNGTGNPNYPACFGDWMISVGAFGDNGTRPNYSSYGGGMDFLAPGGNGGDQNSDILSTWFDGGYYWAHGTSMAAPHVTGVISLIHDYTDLRVSDELEAILRNSCVDIPPSGYDNETGWGRINADLALQLVTFPQEIFRYENSLAQPYVHSISDQFPITCWDWPGLQQGVQYRVKKYEVRGYIVFEDDIQTHFGNTPILVGLGYFSGIEPSGPGDVNYFVRYSQIMPGTLDGDGATLRSYVYEVWSMDDPPVYYGFKPHEPDDVTFMYTAVGNAAPSVPTGLTIAPSPDYHPYLQWDQNSEPDLEGYKVYRMVHGEEEDWVNIATLPASITEYVDTEYSTPHPGPYAEWTDDGDYTVTAIDDNTESEKAPFVTIRVVVPMRPWPKPSKLSTEMEKLPYDFSLSPVYPNPFNAQSSIRYGLPKGSWVILEVFNLSGQRIQTILSAYQSAGYYEEIWNASDFSSGIYLVRMKAGDYIETRRMTLLK